MEIIINKKLSKIFGNQRLLKSKFGNIANKIEVVMSVLKFVDNLGEVPNTPPTRRHKLSGNYKDCWAIDLDANHRLIIMPTTIESDLENIKSIEIIDIVDYH